MVKFKVSKIATLGHRARYTLYNELYLDYVNNFITLTGFSDAYGIEKSTARTILDCGEIINENFKKFLG